MAIDFTDYTALADTLKTVYGEGLLNQFNDEAITYNQFPKSDKVIGGEGYKFGIRYARTQSVGARLEAQKMPAPLVGKYDKGLIQAKQVYGTLKISGKAIETAKSATMSFVNSLSDQIDDIYQSVKNDMNRQSHGDGHGKLAVLSAASDALHQSSTWTVTCNNTLGIQYLVEGMLVDFYDGANVDVSSVASRISYINPSDKTVEMEANDGTTYVADHPTFSAYTVATDAVPDAATMVKMGSRTAAAWTAADTTVEISGLEAIFDDGTNMTEFEDIAESTYPRWKANVMSNSDVPRELSQELMLQACDLTRVRSGRKVDVIRMGVGQRRKYALLLLPDVRFAPTVLKGGYSTFSFQAGDGATDILVDPLTQPGKMYFEPAGVIKKYELLQLGWSDGMGAGNLQWRAGYDEYNLFLKLYTNLGCEERCSLTKITDLVEPSLY